MRSPMPGRTRLAVAGDQEHADVRVGPQELGDVRGPRQAPLDVDPRPGQQPAVRSRPTDPGEERSPKSRAAWQSRTSEAPPRRVAGLGALDQAEAGQPRRRAVLRRPSGGGPAAGLQAEGAGGQQGAVIRPRLAAGDDLLEHRPAYREKPEEAGAPRAWRSRNSPRMIGDRGCPMTTYVNERPCPRADTSDPLAFFRGLALALPLSLLLFGTRCSSRQGGCGPVDRGIVRARRGDRRGRRGCAGGTSAEVVRGGWG